MIPLASIYGMVDNLDFNIGRLLQSLKDQRLDKNTIVIFMSDNGPNGVRYNGYMKGIKGQVDEGGVRVPSMVLWPGQIKAGTSTDQIAAHIDWYPTLQTLCHLNTLAGKPIDGKDLSGIILNKTDTLSDRKIFSHVAFLEKELKPKPGSVRTPRYRMVWKSAAAELYDMSSDPQQLVNLAATDSITLSTLSNLYQSWFSSATQDYQPIKPVNVNTSYIELLHMNLLLPAASIMPKDMAGHMIGSNTGPRLKMRSAGASSAILRPPLQPTSNIPARPEIPVPSSLPTSMRHLSPPLKSSYPLIHH